MRCLYEELPQDGYFVAIYADSSGAELFGFVDGKWRDHDGHPVNLDSLVDAGFLFWVPLPDDFKLWCEQEETNE